MKKIQVKWLPLLAAILLLLTACTQAPDTQTTAETTAFEIDAPATSSPAPQEVLFTVTEHQLPPPEQAFDADFEAFYKAFTKAVQNNDMAFINSILDDEVMSSFGGDLGKGFFHEHWAQKEQALWDELEKIIALGGVYYQAGEYTPELGKCYAAPYVYTNFDGEKFDVYEHFIIAGADVPVYNEASAASSTIDTLNYNIMKFHNSPAFREKGPDDFVRIETQAGTTGYIQKKHLRSPIGYRLCIEQKGGEWKLLWLIAGD